jgi:hypothetical protein
MYMPGRRRTASKPSRTWIVLASYDTAFFLVVGEVVVATRVLS